MRATQKKRKTDIRRPAVRSLKIQPKYRDNKYSTTKVPEIRFSGNWLEKLGFSEGRRISITTMNELLILRVHPEEAVSQQ